MDNYNQNIKSMTTDNVLYSARTCNNLCIPRIESSITREYIYQIIQDKLKLGNIKYLTEIPLKNDPTHKRIIIYMNWDTQNPITSNIQERLATKQHVNFVYDMPWYWKVKAGHIPIKK